MSWGPITGPATVAEALRAAAETAPDRRFLKFGADAWITVGELDESARRLAAGLAQLGVGKGDRVAFMFPNRREVAEVIFACAALGAIEVPINIFLRGDFLDHQLADSEPAVVITDRAGLAGVTAATAGRARVVVLDAPPATAATPATAGEAFDYRDLLTAAPAAPDASASAGDPLSIVYSSGTTGRPKGCVLPHGYFLANARQMVETEWLIRGDLLFTAFPLFHSGGQLISLVAPLLASAAACIAPEFSASGFMAAARAAGATVVWGVGVIGSALLAQPPLPGDREHHLRLAVWSPMGASDQHEFERRFGVPVRSEIFGQTEAQPIGLAGPDREERHRGTQGRVSPLFDVAVLDADDSVLPAGGVGELAVRPRQPAIMYLGYWRDPEATLAASRNLWHHTGDLASLDDEGWITYRGRKKDMIRRRGENFSAFELESAIARHPAIARAAVTTVPAELGDDDIKVTIVLSDAAQSPEPDQLFGYMKERLPYFAIPRFVDLRDELPLTATGSVRKDILEASPPAPVAWDFEELGLTVSRADRR